MSNESSQKQPLNPFLKILMYIFAVPSIAVVEGTKTLFRKTYSRNDSAVPFIIGALVALATGIGVGYQTGWVHELSIWYWLGYGAAATAGTFLYFWPLLYLSLFHWAFRLSETLWKHVNIDAESEYRARSENLPSPWFSQLLLFLGYAAIALTSVYVVYSVDVYVQAHQGGWWWLGAILGIIAVIVVLFIIIALIGLAKDVSGGLALFIVLVLAGLTWWFWAGISGLVVGMWGSLSGNDWGKWGYVAGAIPAVVSAVIVGAALGSLLHWLRVRLIAFGTGALVVWALAPTTSELASSWTAGIETGPLSLVTPGLPWVLSGLILLAYIGFLYPLVHIVITSVGKRLANFLDLLEEVYGDDTRYRGFFAQVTNIAIAGAILWFAPALVAGTLGLTAAWSVWSVTVALALTSYLVLGGALKYAGCWPVSAVSSLAVGYYVFGLLTYGTFASLALSALSAVATFVIGFPLVYLLVRFVTDPLLASWLAEPLVNMHKRAVTAVFDLVETLGQAAENTYGDETAFKPVFLHLVNLVVAAGVAYGGWLLFAGVLQFALWLAIPTVVLTTALSYLLIGKLLQVVGNWTVGVLVGSLGGIIIGTFTHAAQPHGFWVSVPAGLVGAALTFGLIFPVAYLIVRAVVNVTNPEAWLKPLLERPHNWCWKRFVNVWDDFKKIYRDVRDAWKPLWANFQATYAEVSANVKQMFSSNRKDG